MPPRSDAAADAGHKACLLSCQGCTGLLCLHRASGGLLEEAPTPRPELVGPGNQWRIVLFGPARLALPTGGEPRFFEGSPAMLDRMARVCWKSGLRQDGVDRCGAAGCGVREGRGASEAAVCASLQTWPGLLPMFRRRFLGDPEAVMRVLADPHTMVRAQRGGASHVPRRRWGEGKPWPPLRGGRLLGAPVRGPPPPWRRAGGVGAAPPGKRWAGFPSPGRPGRLDPSPCPLPSPASAGSPPCDPLRPRRCALGYVAER